MMVINLLSRQIYDFLTYLAPLIFNCYCPLATSDCFSSRCAMLCTMNFLVCLTYNLFNIVVLYRIMVQYNHNKGKHEHWKNTFVIFFNFKGRIWYVWCLWWRPKSDKKGFCPCNDSRLNKTIQMTHHNLSKYMRRDPLMCMKKRLSHIVKASRLQTQISHTAGFKFGGLFQILVLFSMSRIYLPT